MAAVGPDGCRDPRHLVPVRIARQRRRARTAYGAGRQAGGRREAGNLVRRGTRWPLLVPATKREPPPAARQLEGPPSAAPFYALF